MKLQTGGDFRFAQFYSGSGKAPRWFLMVGYTLMNLIKVGILYAVAKFISIEAALVVYVVVAGLLEGSDAYSEGRDTSMLLWNEQQLLDRINSLEESIKKLDGASH